MLDLFDRLLAEVRAEHEARRERTPGLPLYPGPTPGEEALEVVRRLCARVEALEASTASPPGRERDTQERGETTLPLRRRSGDRSLDDPETPPA